MGPFSIEDAKTVDEVAGSFAGGRQGDVQLGPDFALRLAKIEITSEQLNDLRFGRTILSNAASQGEGALYSAYDALGGFIGVLRRLPAGDLAGAKLVASIA